MARVRPFDIIECALDPEHRFIQEKGVLNVLITSRKAAQSDFVWISSQHMMIQDRTYQMFCEQGFTGFDVLPVDVKMRIRSNGKQESIATPTIWEVKITGWGGIASPGSGVQLIEKCPGCNCQRYKTYTDSSKLVDTKQWDGSDFFMVWPYPVFKFVTDRVARFIQEQKLTAVELLPVEELEWPAWSSPYFTPGRLRDWLPEDRARELGEPLGIY